MIHRIRQTLGRPGIPGLLFSLCIVMFGWPILGAIMSGSLPRAHAFIFAVWFALVLCLALVAWALAFSNDRDGD